jgi:hypothetical protein
MLPLTSNLKGNCAENDFFKNSHPELKQKLYLSINKIKKICPGWYLVQIKDAGAVKFIVLWALIFFGMTARRARDQET